jgi:hypothetical protein
VHGDHPEQRDAAGEVDADEAVEAAARHRDSVVDPAVMALGQELFRDPWMTKGAALERIPS